jgi:hypothetical protein
MPKIVVTGIVDAVAITITLLAGRFLSPGDVELVKFLVAAWQVPLGAIALYFAYEQHLIVEMKRIESEERVAQLYAKNKETN